MKPFVRAIPQPITAGALAAQLASAKIIGDAGRQISGIASLSSAQRGTLTFCDAGNAQDLLRDTLASVVIVPASAGLAPHPDRTYIAVDDVRIAFIESVSRLLPGVGRPAMPALGVHPLAKIADDAEIAPTASIGARVSIGARTQVGPGAVIFEDCTIGADCVVGPCAVIGWVGLSYHDAADGRRLFFPHLGGVRIGDWVDVGASTVYLPRHDVRYVDRRSGQDRQPGVCQPWSRRRAAKHGSRRARRSPDMRTLAPDLYSESAAS